MLQVLAAATVTTVQDTGRRTAESCCLSPQTGAASVIRAVPQLLDPEQEVLLMEAQSESSIATSVDKILLSDRLVSARELASLVGRIIFGGAVFGNISRLTTRYCSISAASAQDWDSKFYLDQYCVRELYFWESNLK